MTARKLNLGKLYQLHGVQCCNVWRNYLIGDNITAEILHVNDLVVPVEDIDDDHTPGSRPGWFKLLTASGVVGYVGEPVFWKYFHLYEGGEAHDYQT